MITPLPHEKGFHVSWDQLHRDARALAWRLQGEAPEGGWRAVVAITRGGMAPAMIVARELDIRTVVVLLFIAYHLADFTWGWVNPAPSGATPYEKVVASFSSVPIAAFYLVANVALGFHLFHGVWSLFQSMGWNNRRFNHLRRSLAVGFTLLVVGGNLSFPIAVQLGIVA